MVWIEISYQDFQTEVSELLFFPALFCYNRIYYYREEVIISLLSEEDYG